MRKRLKELFRTECEKCWWETKEETNLYWDHLCDTCIDCWHHQ